jgi:hypothetical protein
MRVRGPRTSQRELVKLKLPIPREFQERHLFDETSFSKRWEPWQDNRLCAAMQSFLEVEDISKVKWPELTHKVCAVVRRDRINLFPPMCSPYICYVKVEMVFVPIPASSPAAAWFEHPYTNAPFKRRSDTSPPIHPTYPRRRGCRTTKVLSNVGSGG